MYFALQEMRVLWCLSDGGAPVPPGLLELHSALVYMGHTYLVLERLFIVVLVLLQEVKALRFLHGGGAAFSAGLVDLYSAFTYMGHTCLVLERLQGSLLDYVVHSASLNRTQALQNLRLIAVQLLVRLPNLCSAVCFTIECISCIELHDALETTTPSVV